ncbi:MAG: sigma-70 family RNA polymerase sigma factor [Myxococcales bacterium]|nr:sigma-70 family RNA polymerase sigma factor [Myxococcales bacterium]
MPATSRETDNQTAPSMESNPRTEAGAEAQAVERPDRRRNIPNENLPTQYLREMAEIPLLDRDREISLSQAIEEADLVFWRAVLGHAALATLTAELAERLLEEVPGDLDAVVKKVAQRGAKALTPALQRRVEALALKLRELDYDRETQLGVMREIEVAERGDNPRLLRSRGFKKVLGPIKEAARVGQRHRDEFVRANLRLVVMVARRFDYGRLPFGDLIQEGNLGLIKAIERFDHRRGYRFSTYATWWIRHSMSRAMADKGRVIRVPVHVNDASIQIARVKRELSRQLNAAPTDEQIAASAGLTVERYRELQRHLAEQHVPLDSEVLGHDGLQFNELIADPDSPSPMEIVVDATMSQRVQQLFRYLAPMEADVLRRRFGLGRQSQTLRQVGAEYQLSRERIRQIQERALGKIRRLLDEPPDESAVAFV